MTGHPLAAWLRRAVGVALIVGLLISAVAFLSCRATAAASEPRRPEYHDFTKGTATSTSNCRAGQPEP